MAACSPAARTPIRGQRTEAIVARRLPSFRIGNSREPDRE